MSQERPDPTVGGAAHSLPKAGESAAGKSPCGVWAGLTATSPHPPPPPPEPDGGPMGEGRSRTVATRAPDNEVIMS